MEGKEQKTYKDVTPSGHLKGYFMTTLTFTYGLCAKYYIIKADIICYKPVIEAKTGKIH